MLKRYGYAVCHVPKTWVPLCLCVVYNKININVSADTAILILPHGDLQLPGFSHRSKFYLLPDYQRQTISVNWTSVVRCKCCPWVLVLTDSVTVGLMHNFFLCSFSTWVDYVWSFHSLVNSPIRTFSYSIGYIYQFRPCNESQKGVYCVVHNSWVSHWGPMKHTKINPFTSPFT